MSNIKFPFDTNKAIQAVLWLLHRNNGAMDKLTLVKMMFFADREHLVKYGRPVIGGTYYTMEHGPVSSELLDLINSIKNSGNKIPLKLSDHNIKATDSPNANFLSESDVTILDNIYQAYGHLDGFKLRDITHELKAYKKNTPPQGSRSELPYEDFFEDYPENERGMLNVILDEQEAWADFI
jgi:uncharacterized phage-associated protein